MAIQYPAVETALLRLRGAQRRNPALEEKTSSRSFQSIARANLGRANGGGTSWLLGSASAIEIDPPADHFGDFTSLTTRSDNQNCLPSNGALTLVMRRRSPEFDLRLMGCSSLRRARCPAVRLTLDDIED